MAAHGKEDDKGKIFDSYTVRGRANWSKLWLSIYAASFILWKITRIRSPPPTPANTKKTEIREEAEVIEFKIRENDLPSSVDSNCTILPKIPVDNLPTIQCEHEYEVTKQPSEFGDHEPGEHIIIENK